MNNAGQRLRRLREGLHLTVRDVEQASLELSHRKSNPEFAVSIGRLSDIETKGVVPHVFKIYTLSVIYRIEFREVLGWFGLDLEASLEDADIISPPVTHNMQLAANLTQVSVPVCMDPGFDIRKTTNLGRMIQRWGILPVAALRKFAADDFMYAYVGSEDLTMYPLIRPGALLQVDEKKNRVVQGRWANEYERPIYFIESRSGFACSWCDLDRGVLLLVPHPLSPVAVRTMKHPSEGEVIGQVVGVAMQLVAVDVRLPEPPASRTLN
jgi:transcriptional regulator with XRE-family HTH domain